VLPFYTFGFDLAEERPLRGGRSPSSPQEITSFPAERAAF